MRKKQTVRQRKTEETEETTTTETGTETTTATTVVQEFVVERIIRRRVSDGRVEYFLQWKGFTDADNTWEPEDNLDCPELIEEFVKNIHLNEEDESLLSTEPHLIPKEESLEQETEISQQPPYSEQRQSDLQEPHDDQPEIPTNHSDRPEPECIIGSTDRQGELMFLVKWRNSDDVSLLSAREASARCPQVVVDFYEKKLTWHCGDEEQ